MKVKLIANEKEYDAALERADQIFDAEPGTPRGDELGLLLLTIKDYEDKHHPVPVPDTIEALKLKMQEAGWTHKDLKWIGGKSYVSQVLNRKKPLTADMMREIWMRRIIPAEVILGGVRRKRSGMKRDDVVVIGIGRARALAKKSIKKTRAEHLS